MTNATSCSRAEGDAAGRLFWEGVWRDLGPPPVYSGPPFEAHDVLTKLLPRSRNLRSIEVGCVPGNWLVYLNREFGYQVSGIDYSNSLDYVRRNLELNEIIDYELFSGDFFGFTPRQPYDIVLSSGFVEHFDDHTRVVRRHVDIATPGGLIVIIVPNLTHIHKVLCGLFQPSLLAVHRFPLMSRRVLSETLQECGADVLFCDYIRTYRPTYPLPALLSLLSRGVQKVLSVLKLDDIGNRFGSPYLVSVARKRSGGEITSAGSE